MKIAFSSKFSLLDGKAESFTFLLSSFNYYNEYIELIIYGLINHKRVTRSSA